MPALFAINLTCTVPSAAEYPIRIPQGSLPPITWAFQDVYGNPVILTGKTVTLTVFLDNGANQTTQFTHDSAGVGGLTIIASLVTWQPVTNDASVAQIMRYELVDSTDSQELARGVLSVFPV